jgi:hypothetical protein
VHSTRTVFGLCLGGNQREKESTERVGSPEGRRGLTLEADENKKFSCIKHYYKKEIEGVDRAGIDRRRSCTFPFRFDISEQPTESRAASSIRISDSSRRIAVGLD